MTNPKPFLRWAGSKKKLLPRLIKFWSPNYSRYLEPFMGSAVLFFSIAPQQAILSDINEDLIDVFNAIKNSPKAVHRRLRELPRGKSAYYKIRQENTKGLGRLDRAARFIYLNRFCFNGIYRVNQSGKFNVPYGGNRNAYIPTLDDLHAASEILSGTKVLAEDFESILKRNVRRGDFIYLDPPYAQDNRKVFHQYRQNEFGIEDLRRLEKSINLIDDRSAHFLLSYGWCPEALRVFESWPHQKIMVQRNIAGFVKSRRLAAEMLVTNIPTGFGSRNYGR